MAHSLAEECTPLKLEYDSCFNTWFETYLQPMVSDNVNAETRKARTRAKKEEFDAKCGKIWEEYRACVKKAVKKSGLEETLREARLENPLTNLPPPDHPPPSSASSARS